MNFGTSIVCAGPCARECPDLGSTHWCTKGSLSGRDVSILLQDYGQRVLVPLPGGG